MRVKIANIEFEIENSPAGVAEMFDRIDTVL